MKYWFVIAVLGLCWTCIVGPIESSAQDAQGDSNRKVVNRIEPAYPEVARSMGIRGSVRVEALVAPNGTVKSLEVKGGHPVLARAAADAVRKWKWAPATRETKEPIIIKFDPQE